MSLPVLASILIVVLALGYRFYGGFVAPLNGVVATVFIALAVCLLLEARRALAAATA